MRALTLVDRAKLETSTPAMRRRCSIRTTSNVGLLFESFLEANLKCFWNPALREAVRGLEFRGYVHPGVLLVASPSAGDACLDRIRNAWARNVLKPPADHSIAAIGWLPLRVAVAHLRGIRLSSFSIIIWLIETQLKISAC
ncbi:hypothetical protein J437_LFUL012298 [Ladona fulva]|uniref:Uncharacterized protein n=1 Tax=Ladona fulva TaxID=123851 RepID=A0A8K0P1B6_LADFU|nr:hypothetical protein J437_LFUL012298 [Ladona fulva]